MPKAWQPMSAAICAGPVSCCASLSAATGDGGYAIVEPALPLRDFAVSLHWSRRFEADPANRWLRQAMVKLFAAPA